MEVETDNRAEEENEGKEEVTKGCIHKREKVIKYTITYFELLIGWRVFLRFCLAIWAKGGA